MTLSNIKDLRNREGFTLVELLIVIVVIAILAAITIVAYNGVQNKAHTTAANSAATTVIKKAALYQTENQEYPASIATLNGLDQDDPAYLPASDAVEDALTDKPTGDNADISVHYAKCTGTGKDGAKVTYWDFSKGQVSDALTTGTC